MINRLNTLSSHIIFLLAWLLIISCKTIKPVFQNHRFEGDLIMTSIADFSVTKASKYPDSSIFYVYVEDSQKYKTISISQSDTKFYYNDSIQMREEPYFGKLLEFDNRLYHINISDNENKEFRLGIKYGLIEFNEKYKKPYVYFTNNDLQKSMDYIYCKTDYQKGVKVYTNSNMAFKKALQKLNCN